MAKVVSFINLKGGVGKTHITVAVAEFIATEYEKRVLVIDLDPQTNATILLIGEERWKIQEDRGRTLHQLFRDRLERTKKFNLQESIMRGVSNLRGGIPTLDLLPSSINLINIQDSLSLIPSGELYTTLPIVILKEAISDILPLYDYVFIDCPPNLGIITLNGLFVSDYYLIPTIPDILSTYGIPQILSRVAMFREKLNIRVRPLGIIISMYRANNILHKNTIRALRAKGESGEYPPVLDTVIPLTIKAAESARFEEVPTSLKQKYGYGRIYESYKNLSDEILERIERDESQGSD